MNRGVEAMLVAFVLVFFYSLVAVNISYGYESCSWSVTYGRILAHMILFGENLDDKEIVSLLKLYPDVVYIEVDGKRYTVGKSFIVYAIRAVILGSRGLLKPRMVVVGVKP